MSATSDLMRSLAEQFSAGAPSQVDKLGPWARVLMTAALTVSSAVAVSDVQAQQRQAAQHEIMSERSAMRWGGQLGAILGAEAGAVFGQNADPAIRRVIVGASSEMGRNAGRMATSAGYGHQAETTNHVSQEVADRLDQMGLNAAFAYDEMMRISAQFERGAAPRSRVIHAQQRFNAVRNQFAGEVRSLQMQGYSVGTWSHMSTALQQRFVNEQEVAALAKDMADRLNRPGGPGYRDHNIAQERTGLADLRERLAQQQAQDQWNDRTHESMR